MAEASPVDPAPLGSLRLARMTGAQRHRRGAHYTREEDILRVVIPTIVRPLRERIARAGTRGERRALQDELAAFKVLDPACGSGNFLYVAYRELQRLELALIQEIGGPARVSTQQLYGIDIDPRAVELARATLMLGDNIQEGDALFCEWPKVDAIIGNPPFQSKNKMREELGAAYIKRLRAAYRAIPGRADYCVYWFRRAHDELAQGCRAGLVGTNTIRQNYSREGGLDHIVKNGGTITEAVSTQVWPGEAVVHVSIVNWVKEEAPGKKRLLRQIGDSVDGPWAPVMELDRIPASLSDEVDVTGAKVLAANTGAATCCQGQTHGHEGFLLTLGEAAAMRRDAAARGVIHPYLTGEDLLGQPGGQPSRYVIDLNHCDNLQSAARYGAAFARLLDRVKPAIEASALAERRSLDGSSGPRQSHAQRWWKHWRGRGELIERLSSLSRYVVCSRVTKRPIFEFIDSTIRPNDALVAFPFDDDYSFGVLQSEAHWLWFRARCSTMKGDLRYTSNTVFASFVWPQAPAPEHVHAVEERAVALRGLRRRLMERDAMSLRQLYKALADPSEHPLKDAHQALDTAVRAAYGMNAQEDMLAFLLTQNRALAIRESKGETIVGPGRPPGVSS